jgi:hypothetical protein
MFKHLLLTRVATLIVSIALGGLSLFPMGAAFAQTETATIPEKPNIVVIWGDDIGQSDISALHQRDDGLSHPQHRSLSLKG